VDREECGERLRRSEKERERFRFDLVDDDLSTFFDLLRTLLRFFACPSLLLLLL